jgi:hypothetical protein
MKYLAVSTEHASAEVAYEFYRNLFEKKVQHEKDNTVLEFQVFGRHVFKHDWAIETLMAVGEQLPPDMVGIGSPELKNFAPLKRNDWSVAINDTWLLGGINGLQDFHAASPITWKNILDDKYIMTVTGRELVGLALAGYTQKSTSTNEVFVHRDKKRAEDLSLTAYDDEVSKLKDAAQVKDWFASNSNFKIK